LHSSPQLQLFGSRLTIPLTLTVEPPLMIGHPLSNWGDWDAVSLR
jgi:hypothetical protein